MPLDYDLVLHILAVKTCPHTQTHAHDCGLLVSDLKWEIDSSEVNGTDGQTVFPLRRC